MTGDRLLAVPFEYRAPAHTKPISGHMSQMIISLSQLNSRFSHTKPVSPACYSVICTSVTSTKYSLGEVEEKLSEECYSLSLQLCGSSDSIPDLASKAFWKSCLSLENSIHLLAFICSCQEGYLEPGKRSAHCLVSIAKPWSWTERNVLSGLCVIC